MRNRAGWWLVGVALALGGCVDRTIDCGATPGDPVCPRDAGGERDAGAPEDAGLDGAGADAAGCGCSGDTPFCSDAGCVACLMDAQCAGGAPRCVEGACVACAEDADCSAPTAARCEAGVCVGCGADAECAHLEGTPACDAGEGTCVGCTASSGCPAGACDIRRQVCTEVPLRSSGPCEPCVADTQCRAGQLCVPTRFRGADAGLRCLWRQAAVPGGDCARVHPYMSTEAVTSVEGTADTVCGLRSSTCAALADFSVQTCDAPAAGADPACGGEGLDDGFCAAFGPTTNYCTVGCSSSADCPCTDGTCAEVFRCASGFCSLSARCTLGVDC